MLTSSNDALYRKLTGMAGIREPDAGPQRGLVGRHRLPAGCLQVGLHPLVARGGFLRVGDADDAAEFHGELDVMLGVLAALAGVAVEYFFAHDPGEDGVQTPAQGHRIPQSGAHAFAGEGRHQVSRVARDQAATVAP
ncbi:hypothetical protein D9M71_255440 [compost metagenome]